MTSTIELQIRDWLDPDGTRDNFEDGDWIGGFENQELGHPDLGQRVVMVFGPEDWNTAIIGKTTKPDTQQLIGWRYVLGGKFRDPDEAIAFVNYDETPPMKHPYPEFAHFQDPTPKGE